MIRSLPGAAEKRTARIGGATWIQARRCVSRRVDSTSLSRRSLSGRCCVEVEMLCGGEALCVHIRYTGKAKRDTKYGVESSHIRFSRGAAGLHNTCRKMNETEDSAHRWGREKYISYHKNELERSHFNQTDQMYTHTSPHQLLKPLFWNINKNYSSLQILKYLFALFNVTFKYFSNNNTACLLNVSCGLFAILFSISLICKT